MDTRLVQDPEEFANFGHLTYLEPDNIYMGSTVANELFKAMGGEGQVIHTQGLSSPIPAPRVGPRDSTRRWRTTRTSKWSTKRPATGKPDQVASLWQDLLQRFPDVGAGSSTPTTWPSPRASVVEAAGLQDQVMIVGVDGLKNVCEAILEDKLLASVINPSGRIHGGAIWAGYLTVSGTDNGREHAEVHPHRRRPDHQGQRGRLHLAARQHPVLGSRQSGVENSKGRRV